MEKSTSSKEERKSSEENRSDKSSSSSSVTRLQIPYLEATLAKQATLFYGKIVWHSRYFILEDGKLRYWINKKEKARKISPKKISLEGCKVTPWKCKQQLYAIRIYNSKLNKDWYLGCENMTIAKEWVRGLKLATGEDDREESRTLEQSKSLKVINQGNPDSDDVSSESESRSSRSDSDSDSVSVKKPPEKQLETTKKKSSQETSSLRTSEINTQPPQKRKQNPKTTQPDPSTTDSSSESSNKESPRKKSNREGFASPLRSTRPKFSESNSSETSSIDSDLVRSNQKIPRKSAKQPVVNNQETSSDETS